MKLDDLFDDAANCKECGTLLPVDRYYGRRMFCSIPCQRADYAKLTKASIRDAKRGRKCAHCDSEISVEKNSKAIYCSVICQQRACHEVRRTRFPQTCKICGVGFNGHNERQKYCSPRCRAKAGIAVRALKWKPKMLCEQCGTPFTARPGGRHCSHACDRKTRREERAKVMAGPANDT